MGVVKRIYFILLVVVLISICNGADPNYDYNVCPHKNAYVAVDGTCDSYVECRENLQSHLVCPDGLNFNPAAEFPDYPCSYPMDVPCDDRKRSKPPQPTEDCPHQYGYFPSPDQAEECGHYRICIEGRAIDLTCPPGLAFNPEISQCDWPEKVPSCNANDFLGFSCPPGELDESGNPVVTNHSYGNDCFGFYTCMEGKGRLLSCDVGLAFDAASGHCVNSELVNCANSAPHPY